MAPPSGTLRVGRYFLALLALIAVLYVVVFFPSNRHTPKLGIDLAGGLRVQFTALVPKGSPAPTGTQMEQARQILENRINAQGVSGATVVRQGSDQLIVEIPSATNVDIARLGEAAILNFRGLMAPVVPVVCGTTAATGSASATPTSTSTGSASPTTGASTSTTTQPAASTGTKTASSGASTPTTGAASANALHARRLAAPSSTAASTTPAKTAASTTPAKTATSKTPATTPASTPATSATGSGTSSASASTTAPAAKCTSDPFAAVVKADPTLKTLLEPSLASKQVGLNSETCPTTAMPSVVSGGPAATCNAFDKLTATQQNEIVAALGNFDCASSESEADIAYNYYIACGDYPPGSGSKTGGVYLLSHVIVKGQQIDSAAAQAPNGQGDVNYSVNLQLTSSGADNWSKWTGKYNTNNTDPTGSPCIGSTSIGCGTSLTTGTGCGSANFTCSTYVGFTINGGVLASPYNRTQLDVQSSISGGFGQSEAQSLADSLNGGKLPISFRRDQSQTVSATLGTTQLNAAFIAGGIGLLLVVLYSLLYYRGLGIVTIASLVVSAILTYAMLVILGQQIGFTLDLAGIAGFIVALGITADSFVVFFERIKDEVHEGRSIRVAVPRAWVRARRTILSADTVSFLAAAILYFFASADVKGFAFTLGLSTILDLVVVFLFTHPIVSLLSRSRAFGSPRFTGLNAVRSGPTLPDEPAAARARSGKRTRTATGSTEPAADRTRPPGAVDELERDDESGSGEARPAKGAGPSGGTAAERAAQRRARQREQQRENGEDT